MATGSAVTAPLATGASSSFASGLPKHAPSTCGMAGEPTIGERERFELDRFRCILLSQPGDLPLDFCESSGEFGSAEGDS